MKKLKIHYETQIQQVGESLLQFPWGDQDAYANWLSQTYHFANATTRLLCLVAALVPYTEQEMHHRFIDHAKEERSHEKLIIQDLKHANLAAVRPATAITQAFYQSQYFWIQNQSPLSFFGYVLMLEGIAAQFGMQVYALAKASFGEKACSFLRVHAIEDQDHIAKAFMSLDKISTDVEQKIIENFDFSAGLYQLLLEEAGKNSKFKKTHTQAA